MNLATFDESALEPLHELQVEGEPNFVGGLISDYVIQVDELDKTIRDSQAGGDHHGLERAAHKLKSSSAVLGLAKVAAICLAVEEGARAGRQTEQHVSALLQALPEAVSALTHYRSKLC